MRGAQPWSHTAWLQVLTSHTTLTSPVSYLRSQPILLSTEAPMRRLSRRLTVMMNEVIRLSDELKVRHLSAPNQHHVVLLSISM